MKEKKEERGRKETSLRVCKRLSWKSFRLRKRSWGRRKEAEKKDRRKRKRRRAGGGGRKGEKEKEEEETPLREP